MIRSKDFKFNFDRPLLAATRKLDAARYSAERAEE